MPFAMPRWAWWGLGAVLALLALLAAVNHIYGKGYKAGEAETDAKWQKASDEAVKRAQNSANKADKAAAARTADFAAKVQDEKEKLDAAQKDGTSPLDALFPHAS